MTSPLSEHTVHVPPRQTCHLRAEHPVLGASIVLGDVQWDERDQDTRPDPLSALHLAVDPAHKLPPVKFDEYGARVGVAPSKFSIEPTKTVYVEIGNCSDSPLVVTFEIWGKS